MKDQIKTKTHELVNETIENIQTMVRIPSVRNVEDGTKEAPFGRAIGEALDTFLAMASEIGMRTYRDPEGHYGYAEIGPKESEMVGILGHLDVVPVGDEEQWTLGKPFSGDIVDEKIVARGTLDDKGPMVINLMGIKALVELGHTFNNRVRLIVGCAEETTWECINAYNEKEEHPAYGYSPDANFPIINAEKTISQFDVKGKCDVDFTLTSTGAYNSVADSAIYTGSKAEEVAAEMEKLGYDFNRLADDKIEALGKSAHAMACHLGVNAIAHICEAMHAVGETTPGIEFVATKVKDTFNGELICGVVEEEVSGKLTLNVGNVMVKDGEELFGFDTRIPVLANEKDIIAEYTKAVESCGMTYVQHKIQDKLYVAEDDSLIQTLMGVYKEVTGVEEVKLLSSGGGTYARSMSKGVAFGMLLDGMEDNMHQPNEHLEVKYVPLILEIYTNAIYELTK